MKWPFVILSAQYFSSTISSQQTSRPPQGQMSFGNKFNSIVKTFNHPTPKPERNLNSFFGDICRTWPELTLALRAGIVAMVNAKMMKF